jgi:hypothetical protein
MRGAAATNGSIPRRNEPRALNLIYKEAYGADGPITGSGDGAMDIQQVLQQTNAIDAISRELGVDPGTAKQGAQALLPEILNGFKEPVAAPEPQAAVSGEPLGGFGSVLETISALGGGGLLDNVISNQPTEVDKGNQILGQIFGSKDGSRAIAAQAAAQSGVEPSLLKKMLPILAMVAAGYVAKQASRGGEAGEGGLAGGLGGALGGALGGILGGQAAPADRPTASPSQSGDILGQLIGAAGKYFSR